MRISCVLPAILSVLAVLSTVPSFAQSPPNAAPTPHVEAHATWDDRYIYFAFLVDDTDLRGTNTKPMSDVIHDDSIAVYLQTGKDRPDGPNADSHGMIVSVAGGFQFVRGDAGGKGFGPRPLFSIKYGVTVAGTINRSDDRDRNYTVTLAIPFDALGIDSKALTPGLEFGFNAVARSKDGKLTALVGDAKNEADIAHPKQWARLVLAGDQGDANAQKAGAIVAPLSKAKSPLIDGTFRPNDWPAGGNFGFTSPDIPKAAVVVQPTLLPGSDADNVAPSIDLPNPVKGMERRVLARYLLAYQGDGRKAANPFRGVFGPDGSLLLPEQPAVGVGPWFSTDRVAWHRGQLTELRKTGIDAALVNLSGPESETGPLDEKSLVVLVAALREMSADNVNVPELAPSFDTRLLVPPTAPKPDLGTPAGRGILYRAVSRWFDTVPAENRLRVALPADTTGRVVFAYPVFLDNADGLTNSGGPEWAEVLRKQFASQYGPVTGGTTILFVGGEGFGASPALAGTAPLRSGGAGVGPIKTFVVQPGVAAPDVMPDGKPDGLQKFVARRAGATYREAWDAATAAQPTWIIIDSWNDYARGSAIDTSRQYGRQYQDATRIALIQSSGLPPRALRWLANDAPRRMRPGQLVSVSVQVANAGAQILRGTDGVALTYRWRKGNTVVAEGPLRIKLSNALLPTQTAQLAIGVLSAQPQADGTLQPLAIGDYTLEFDLADTKDGKTVLLSESSPETTAPLRVPVTVMPLADAVEIAGSTTTPLLMSGGNYGSKVRLRWLGDSPVPTDSARLVYQILSEDGKETLYTGTAPLLHPLTPGTWETVPVILQVGDATTAIPPAAAEFRKTPTDTSGGYQLRWLLTRTDAANAVPGQYVEHISVYPTEEEASLTFTTDKPAVLNANALTTFPVNLTNRGSLKWTKDGFRLGYHWYYPDGMEMLWKPQITVPLPRDVNPGETVTVTMSVRAPDRAGEYILAADLLRNPDNYLSTRLITRANDTGLLPCLVQGGRLQFVDLSKMFNIDAFSADPNAKDGDFDGAGNTFPSECFPPDAFGIAAYFADFKEAHAVPVYPAGHFSDMSPSARAVAFRYGSHADRAKNAIACDGQRIDLRGRYTGIHLALAASGGKDVPITVVLHYKGNKDDKVEMVVADWNRSPGVLDAIAARAPYRRSPAGDAPIPCVARYTVIPLDVTRDLESIELPKEQRVKVFAVTLER